jgi:hypothetical protein
VFPGLLHRAVFIFVHALVDFLLVLALCYACVCVHTLCSSFGIPVHEPATGGVPRSCIELISMCAVNLFGPAVSAASKVFLFSFSPVFILHSLRDFLCLQSGLAFLVDQRPVLVKN